MIDELKKLGLAGLGAAALVIEKAGEAVDTLAKHGEKALEDTRETREEISRSISECFKKAEPEVEEIIDKISQLGEDSLAVIREKLAELEVLHAQRAAEQAQREAQAHADAINIEFDEPEEATADENAPSDETHAND